MYHDHFFNANNLHDRFLPERPVTTFINLYICEHKYRSVLVHKKNKIKGENNALYQRLTFILS